MMLVYNLLEMHASQVFWNEFFKQIYEQSLLIFKSEGYLKVQLLSEEKFILYIEYRKTSINVRGNY